MTTFNVLRIDAYARFDHKDAKIQKQKFKFGTRSAVQIEFCQIAFQPLLVPRGFPNTSNTMENRRQKYLANILRKCFVQLDKI